MIYMAMARNWTATAGQIDRLAAFIDEESTKAASPARDQLLVEDLLIVRWHSICSVIRYSEENLKMGHTNRDHLARIETEARKLARSAAFSGFRSIQSVLLARGYSEVGKIFSNRWTQFELDRLCEKARSDSRVNEPRLHVEQAA
jgi:hypothetical protein